MKDLKAIKVPGADLIANFLNSRNVREKQMIIVFMVIFAVAVDYLLWLNPVMHFLFDVAPKISPLKAELEDLKAEQRDKESIRKKWGESRSQLADREKMFIAPDETPALLEQLSKIAQKSGVRIVSLEPSDTKSSSSKKMYTPLPILVKASAGTHEFGAFLAQLETGSTFFSIKNLKISANPINERKHLIELTMEAVKRDKSS